MEHLHCSRHDSDLRQYRDSLGILELKRERAPFTSFCVSNRRRQWHPTPVLLPGQSHGWRWSIPLWGVLYNYYILCHFTWVPLGFPSVGGLAWFYSLSQIQFSAFHIQVFHPQLTCLYVPILSMRKNMISSLGTVPCLQRFLSLHLVTPSLSHLSSHTFLGALCLRTQDHEKCTVFCEQQHCDWHLRDQPVFINVPDQEKVLWYLLRELPWAYAHTMPGPQVLAAPTSAWAGL